MSTVATLAPPCGGLCCQTGGQGQMAVGSPVQWLLREAVRQPWWAKGRNQRPPPPVLPPAPRVSTCSPGAALASPDPLLFPAVSWVLLTDLCLFTGGAGPL